MPSNPLKQIGDDLRELEAGCEPHVFRKQLALMLVELLDNFAIETALDVLTAALVSMAYSAGCERAELDRQIDRVWALAETVREREQ